MRNAVGQRQRHAGVVGPLAGLEPVRASVPISRDLGERTGGPELDRRAQGVADRQAEASPPAAGRPWMGREADQSSWWFLILIDAPPEDGLAAADTIVNALASTLPSSLTGRR